VTPDPQPASEANARHTLLVVVDVRAYLEGIIVHLNNCPGLQIIGTGASIQDVLEMTPRLRPKIVLLDMALDHSLAATRRLRQLVPETRVIALAVTEADASVIACAEAGAAGYVPRQASLAELTTILISAARGEALCPPRITAALLQRVESLAAERRGPPCDAVLTPREKEILALIDDGLSNKQIAQRLFIEVPTVKNHVHNILEKLNVSRRSEAAAQARGHRRFNGPALLENRGQIARGRRGMGVVPAR
jgi:two-component system nitrate/nitrite response regulator NarL